MQADEPSDPYLMNGYDRKGLTLAHSGNESVKIRVEVDVTGNGDWVLYKAFDVPAGKGIKYQFPDSLAANWVRVVTDKPTTATAQFTYE